MTRANLTAEPRDVILTNTAFLMTDIARRYRTTFDGRILHLHLSRSEWWLLSHLHFFDGSTQQELCEIMDIKKAGIGKLIDRLEKAGLVVRRTDPQDLRTRQVFLTPKSRPLVNELQAHSRQIETQALAVLTKVERRTLNRLLKKLRQGFLSREQPAG